MDKQHKILIVEDEPALSRALVTKFKKEGFTVFKASDGEEGLRIALQEHPHIILLDIVMPIMDGITMLEKLRADVWGKDVAVIMLTNLADEVKVAEVMRFGSRDFLIKTDWQLSDVVKKVKDRLKI
ncbi:MAG TPA: response regulator [Candidatus Magasanikbacteria bacterium]|nr:response regulator [Candidatus Magasanikbacteria bacterium]